jgi:hypothetical protein
VCRDREPVTIHGGLGGAPGTRPFLFLALGSLTVKSAKFGHMLLDVHGKAEAGQLGTRLVVVMPEDGFADRVLTVAGVKSLIDLHSELGNLGRCEVNRWPCGTRPLALPPGPAAGLWPAGRPPHKAPREPEGSHCPW